MCDRKVTAVTEKVTVRPVDTISREVYNSVNRAEVSGEELVDTRVDTRNNVVQFRARKEPDTYVFSNGMRVPVPRTREEYLATARLVLDEFSFLQICGGILSREYYETLHEMHRSVVDSYFRYDS